MFDDESELGELVVQEVGFPSFNLVCEKVLFEGVTCSDNQHCLSMGISVNQSGLPHSVLMICYDGH